MIDPIDEDERRFLLAELLWERFGQRPGRTAPRVEDTPEAIAERRRVLCGHEMERGAA